MVIALVFLVALVASVVLVLRWFRANREAIGAWITQRQRQIASSSRFLGLRERHPRVWTFVVARFARGEYFGLHLTIGFLLSLAALWLFAGVTEDVVNHEPLTVVDVRCATWFRAHATPFGDHVGVAVTTVGSPLAMAILWLAVALVLARRRSWIVLSGWVAAFAGGGALDWALKRAIHRPRPAGANAFLFGIDRSFSFPSGHAMGSLIGYGMLAYLLIAFWRRARRHAGVVITGALLVVLAIGVSRLYLGVHFLSDVIGGYAAGLLWLATCVTGIEIALRQRGLSPWELGLERRQRRRPAQAANNA